MLTYFGLETAVFEMRMNARAGVDRLIEIDRDSYLSTLQLKDAILASDPQYYSCFAPESDMAAWDALEVLLPEMAANYPDLFLLERRGTEYAWTNRAIGHNWSFLFGQSKTLPYAPLDWIGRQVPEDLILLSHTDLGRAVCLAGQLCFAAAWSLRKKIGQPFLEVHAQVPGFAESIGQASDSMMSRLKPGRPTWRLNWGIAATDRLNLSPATSSEWLPEWDKVTAQNAGQRCWWRVERQTMSRFARSKCTLFTIRTYLTRLDEVAADPHRRQMMLGVLHTMPEPTRRYKRLDAIAESIIEYLTNLTQAKEG